MRRTITYDLPRDFGMVFKTESWQIGKSIINSARASSKKNSGSNISFCWLITQSTERQSSTYTHNQLTHSLTHYTARTDRADGRRVTRHWKIGGAKKTHGPNIGWHVPVRGSVFGPEKNGNTCFYCIGSISFPDDVLLAQQARRAT